MEQMYDSKMKELGYNQLVCDIFANWEDVKDEILPPDRKQGTGNGTVHVFLGAADSELRKEFPAYYEKVSNGEDTAVGAVKVKHYFLTTNVLSMLGYICRYYFKKNTDFNNIAKSILQQLEDETDESGLLATESFFKLSTGSSRLRPYFKQFDEKGAFHKIIRPLLLPDSSYKISLFKNEEGEYAALWLIGFNYLSNFEADSNDRYTKKEDSKSELPLQQIFYGAPGTGKSHCIKDDAAVKVADAKTLVFRTTFHPDSDYSTFVGCYKPTTSKSGIRGKQPILDYDSLVDKFKEYLNVPNVNITKACTLFGFDYHDSIIRTQENGRKVMDLVNDAYKSNTSYDSVVRGGMACYEQNPIQENDSKITYSFIPQAFLQAYVAAWNNPDDKVFLVIEEINRGNCAQIFGDLFQLLDRDDEGASEYPIMADKDLCKYLNGNDEEGQPVLTNKDGIKDGKLCLPKNLHIWATMNTSDQSLFPIDSAFKRRWDWVYMPIDDAGKNWKIEVNGHEYDWYRFLTAINKEVFDLTHSEDKQLGYFFAKAKDGKIDAATLVNKVYFYLWTDVFKDYDYESQKAFKKSDGNAPISFKEFFSKGKVDEIMAEQVLINLELNKPKETAEE